MIIETPERCGRGPDPDVLGHREHDVPPVRSTLSDRGADSGGGGGDWAVCFRRAQASSNANSPGLGVDRLVSAGAPEQPIVLWHENLSLVEDRPCWLTRRWAEGGPPMASYTTHVFGGTLMTTWSMPWF